MKSKSKFALIVLPIFVLVGGTIGYLTFDLDDFLYGVVKGEFQKDTHDNLQRDGIEILLAGTGSPRHAKDRGQSCLGVVGAGVFLLFDTGHGCAGRLLDMEAPLGQISSVFLTHLHADHVAGLGEIINNSWLFGRIADLLVYGPPGTKKVVDGFAEAYKPEVENKASLREKNELDPSLSIAESRTITVEDKDAHTVYEKNGLVVKVFRIEHAGFEYAYGYRIEYGGSVMVISGDTRFSQLMIRHAENADMLIHEAYSKRMMDIVARVVDDLKVGLNSKAIHTIGEAHTSTLDVAKVAKEAGVHKLILTHIIPPLPNVITEKIFVLDMDDIYDGEIILARDGMRLTLPVKNEGEKGG